MTATPHNGKEADFQLFLSLLDSDRFYGKFRDGVHKVETSDIMRRMVKEDMLRFDGTHLFPLRRAYTASYKLSPAEAALYEAVTSYVRGEMNRADSLQDTLVRAVSVLRWLHSNGVLLQARKRSTSHFGGVIPRCSGVWRKSGCVLVAVCCSARRNRLEFQTTYGTPRTSFSPRSSRR